MNGKLFIKLSILTILLTLGFGKINYSVDANLQKELPPEYPEEIYIGDFNPDSIGWNDLDWPVIESTDSLIELRSMGGPDNFGYTWDNSEPFNWIDASTGTDTGFTGYSYGQGVGPISLPFSFNFYGLNYSEIYIAASGYISFSESDSWIWQSEIPSVEKPNNVIAPFWSPNEIVDGESWVKYDSGGLEPNRYFIVEWHNVSIDASNYTYQMILHEDGDIVFQYGTMVYSGIGASGGIEDQYGSDGLSIGVGFSYEPSSNSAVRISRPAPSPRIGFTERYFGAFAQTGEISEFEIFFSNIGDLGADTYNITSTSVWDVHIYNSGGNLLVDTNSDSIPDTGSIPQGNSDSIVVMIDTPTMAVVGDENEVVVRFTSTNDPTVNAEISLETAVPYPFAQSYALIADDTLQLDIFHPQTEFNHIIGSRHNSRATAIAETKEGFIYLMNSEYSPEPGFYISEIWFSLLDRAGNIIELETKLTDHSGESFYNRDDGPTVVTAPNGKIGIAWARTTYDVENGLQNSNVFLSILDEYGKVTTPPINITNNTQWGSGIVENPSYRNVLIDVTPDNRFVLAWSDEDYVDLFYTAIVDSGGNIIQPMTYINATNQQAGHSLLALENGNIFFAFFQYNPFGDFGKLFYIVFNHAGEIIKPTTTITVNNGHTQSDAVQLDDGTIILSWTDYNNRDRVMYMSFYGTNYEIKTNPGYFFNPLAPQGNGNISLTPTEDGLAILTWSDTTFAGYENSSHLYYALMDSSCNLTFGPMIFKAGDSIVPLSDGYSNTSFSGVPPVITSADNTAFTEGTPGSFEITASGVPLYPAIFTTDTLPGGVSLVDNGNGTATLSGTPSQGTGGLNPFSLSASNGVLPDGSQEFTLKVNTVTNIDSSGGVIVNHNGNTEVTVPKNAVEGNTEFVFEPLVNPTESIGVFRFGGISFRLTASDLSGPVTEFNSPIKIKIGYDETLLGGSDEETILIYYWNEGTDAWEDAACSEYTRNLDENWFSVDICHLSEFAVLGEGDNIFLPLILR
jgi:hypothetical protein